MKKRNPLVRASGAACLFSAAMVGCRAHAALVTDSYQFNNPASDTSIVSGTFTYDTSNPTILTDLTITARGQTFDTAAANYVNDMPTFDGSELEGEFNAAFQIIAEPYSFDVDFGPGAVGSGIELYNTTPTLSITFSGPITYSLSNVAGSGSSAPLPGGAIGGFAAMLAAGGFAAKTRKPAQ